MGGGGGRQEVSGSGEAWKRQELQLSKEGCCLPRVEEALCIARHPGSLTSPERLALLVTMAAMSSSKRSTRCAHMGWVGERGLGVRTGKIRSTVMLT